MDVGDILLEVGRNLNRTVSSVSATGGVTLLNAWMRDWSIRFPTMPTLETSAVMTVSSGTKTYSLASDIDKVYDMYLPSQAVFISKMTEEQMHVISPSGSSITGAPVAWAPYGESQVIFYPTPDSSYDISYSYFADVTVVSATSNTPVSIDAKYHDAGVWYVTWRMAQRMGDMETTQLAVAEYNRLFESAKLDMAERFAGASRVRTGHEYGSTGFIGNDKASRFFFGDDN